MRGIVTTFCAASAVALLAAPALATHDAGSRYELLRMADDGTLLVARCDVQGEGGTLEVLSKKGKRLEQLDAVEGKTLPFCRAPRVFMTDKDLDEKLKGAITRHQLAHAAVRTSAMSPSGARFVVDGTHPGGVDLRLVEGGKVTRKKTVKAKQGFSSFNLDVRVTWHPEELYAVAYGNKVSGLTEGTQHWTPFIVRWTPRKKRARKTTPEHLANVWAGLGKALLKKCKKSEPHCEFAERDFTNALEMDPQHAAALAGRAQLDSIREKRRAAAQRKR